MTKIKTFYGDITKLKVDAIVNSANSSLAGGDGVDEAIQRAAGPKLYFEGRYIVKTKYPNGFPVGEAVITPGFNLPAKYVIHTVGPIWYGGENDEPKKLYNCYYNSLKLAKENKIKTIAFPAISTNFFQYPREKAKKVAEKAVHDFVSKYPDAFDEIIFVTYKHAHRYI